MFETNYRSEQQHIFELFYFKVFVTTVFPTPLSKNITKPQDDDDEDVYAGKTKYFEEVNGKGLD